MYVLREIIKYKRVLGVAILVVFLWYVDLGKMTDALRGMTFVYLLAIVPLFFLLIMIKTLRWQQILGSDEIALPFKPLYGAYLTSVCVGAVTPGRLGEVIKYRYVRNNGIGVRVSFCSAVSDRLWDVLFLVVIGMIGLGFVGRTVVKLDLKYELAILGIPLLVTIFLVFKRTLTGLFLKLAAMPLSAKYRELMQSEGEKFMDQIFESNRRRFWRLTSITIISWFVYFFQSYLVAASFGFPLSFLQVATVVTFSSIASLLPITYLGIGTRDTVFVLILKPWGLSNEQALAFSLAMLATFGIGVCISAILMSIYPVDF